MRDPMTSKAILLTALVLCAGLGLGACSGGGSDPIAPVANGDVLSQLGFDTELPAERDDLSGDPIGDNPLGTSVGALKPACEIFWMNGGLTAGPDARIQDDGKGQPAYGNLHTLEGDLAWTTTDFKNAIGADIDGDGLDEIVIAYLLTYQVEEEPGVFRLHADFHVKTIDKGAAGAGGYTEHDELIEEDLSMRFTEGRLTFPRLPTLAKGDFDDDGREEVVVGLWDLYLIKLPVSGVPLEVSTKPYSGAPTGFIPLSGLFVAAGDLDGNGSDEIVVTEGPNCDLLRWSPAGGFEPEFAFWNYRTIPAPASLPGLKFQDSVDVAVGDIDDDGKNEVVFHGRLVDVGDRTNDCLVAAMRLNPAGDGFEPLDFHVQTYGEFRGSPDTPGGSDFRTTLALLDFDGDGSLEIFARNWLWRYDETPRVYGGSEAVYGLDQGFPSARAERLQNLVVGSNWPPRNFDVADVNGDYRDDLVYSWANGNGSAMGVRAWVRNSVGDPTDVVIADAVAVTSNSKHARICLANMDTDSTIVRYTGEHELLFSEPEVIAVLACPPYHGGIGQTSDLTGTTIGKRTGMQVVEEQSLGVSVGFSVGVELEDDLFTQSKFAHSLRVDMETGFRRMQVAEQSESIAYTSGFDEDKVIFAAVPFDVYYYEVLNAGRDSELKEGGYLTLSIPRRPQILSTSREYFNANNGDYPDIGPEVLGHTIGVVDSYPASPHTGGVWSQTTSVGQGSGHNTVTIDRTTGAGFGTSFDFAVSVESEIGAGGVVVGAYGAFRFGYDYEVTQTEQTFYQGIVNNIPDGYPLSEYGYSWGICAYLYPPTSGRITVVNYWVED